MGYVKHHAIIVTGWKEESVDTANAMARNIFKRCFKESFKDATKLVSDVMEGVINGQYTFIIIPDGSKEGWEDSIYGDNARKEFLDFLDVADMNLDYVEVKFGGDDNYNAIERTAKQIPEE